jgi:hypothetical protein
VSYWADCRNIHFSIERVTFQLHHSWMGSDTVLGVISVPRGRVGMSLLFFIVAMGPMAALGIYNPPVVHHSPARCVAEPGSIPALYCPAPTAPAAPSHHRHRQKAG